MPSMKSKTFKQPDEVAEASHRPDIDGEALAKAIKVAAEASPNGGTYKQALGQIGGVADEGYRNALTEALILHHVHHLQGYADPAHSGHATAGSVSPRHPDRVAVTCGNPSDRLPNNITDGPAFIF
jgi:hypothetical protein